MRILTWNCNGAFRNKFQYVQEYDADIYIIQECENPEKTSGKKGKEYGEFAKNSIWIGDNKNKGLGIFAKKNIDIKKNNWDNIWRERELKWFISVKVNNSFNLIGVWNHHANSKYFGYIGQFWNYLSINKDRFKECIVCGDFNSNATWDEWDRWWNHSDVVRELKKLDIESIYHLKKDIKHGEEKQKTFYQYRHEDKGYHIDYIFMSRSFSELYKNLIYGDFSKCKDKSDHVPIIYEF